LRQFKTGQKVSKGQVIGLVGPTFPGSSGPHLHLERYFNGQLDWQVHKRFEKAVQKNEN
jgi:murein DD-endopeptidase MepM/ murein hydrolase activator NlpD